MIKESFRIFGEKEKEVVERKCLWKRTLLGKHLRGERVKKVARFWKESWW